MSEQQVWRVEKHTPHEDRRSRLVLLMNDAMGIELEVRHAGNNSVRERERAAAKIASALNAQREKGAER